MLGTNDAHQAKGEPEKVENALEELVKKITSTVRNAKVILILPPGTNTMLCCQRMDKIVHPGVRKQKLERNWNAQS